jgi:HKD family nuclease
LYSAVDVKMKLEKQYTSTIHLKARPFQEREWWSWNATEVWIYGSGKRTRNALVILLELEMAAGVEEEEDSLLSVA